ALRADSLREAPEEDRERDADELDEQDAGDRHVLRDLERGREERRHAVDRADPVAVEEEGDEEQERLAVPPELAQRLADAHERDLHRILPDALVRLDR